MPQRTTTVMKALLYRGPGVIDWADVALPKMHDSRDAIVRVDAVTICGTDLHILKGRLAGGRVRSDPRTRGRRHISGCGRCRFCGTGPYGQCLDAGGLVDTYSTPTLMSMLAAGQLDTASYITHHFSMDQMIQAYNVSSRASATGALKVALTRS